MNTQNIKDAMIVFYGLKTKQDELLRVASTKSASDEVRLAAALLLCTCDSNERKAGE